ncbi:LytR/AlgR family response regulator transcription factor [Flavisolibacter nicotianae]|uniref:LytR/AlgR family response regulator transcription factor n=1 Tax=Flavisolibacter nicotianae TaxID=2364882 RepID=UPI000EB49B2B|nr:LytTR family DNA-binding domain-containing protein [Flavisolibacter nicotianae]
MIKAVIIEDEKRAASYLSAMLREVDPEILILKVLDSVESGVSYLSANGKVDVIFSDVQLGDGLSFSIFEKVNNTAPVVFITGYDRFMLDAFENNGIDYLLKPVDKEDLAKALKKYKGLERHFTHEKPEEAMSQLLQYINGGRKKRILVRKGIENITMPLSDIVLFYTENKIVHALDRTGRKFMVDKNLCDLETELDENTFFRANRQYILNINYIKSFKPYERVKLWVDLVLPDIDHSIIISQETAPMFRRWLLEA